MSIYKLVAICQSHLKKVQPMVAQKENILTLSLTSLTCVFSPVIVILFVLRKHYKKDSLANMKNSGEIHEQLVTYDEEGGGEMDTNGYADLKKKTLIPNPGCVSLIRLPTNSGNIAA